jgi:hypothetical protein
MRPESRWRCGAPVITDVQNRKVLAGTRMLHQLHTELGSLGINLRIVGARGRVSDLLRAEGIDEKVGGLDRLKTLDELLESARKEPT